MIGDFTDCQLTIGDLRIDDWRLTDCRFPRLPILRSAPIEPRKFTIINRQSSIDIRQSAIRQSTIRHSTIRNRQSVESTITNRQSAISGLDNALIVLLRLDEPHAELVEQIVDELGLGIGEIPVRALLKHSDDLDHLSGRDEVGLGGFAGIGIGYITKVHGCRRRQRQQEAGECNARWFLIFHFAMLA
jgi:hypothetical protein